MTCPLTTPSGKVCYFVADHPGRVHVDLSDGGMVVWSLPDAAPFANRPAVPADPLQDAPAALRAAAEHEGCGADGCVTFGGCAVCGPEAEFEAARPAILGLPPRFEGEPESAWLS